LRFDLLFTVTITGVIIIGLLILILAQMAIQLTFKHLFYTPFLNQGQKVIQFLASLKLF